MAERLACVHYAVYYPYQGSADVAKKILEFYETNQRAEADALLKELGPEWRIERLSEKFQGVPSWMAAPMMASEALQAQRDAINHHADLMQRAAMLIMEESQELRNIRATLLVNFELDEKLTTHEMLMSVLRHQAKRRKP